MKKEVQKIKYKEVEYPAMIRKEVNGSYLVMFPDFPGCVTFGNTFEQAEKMGKEALELWLEVLNEEKEEYFIYKEAPIFSGFRVNIPA